MGSQGAPRPVVGRRVATALKGLIVLVTICAGGASVGLTALPADAAGQTRRLGVSLALTRTAMTGVAEGASWDQGRTTLDVGVVGSLALGEVASIGTAARYGRRGGGRQYGAGELGVEAANVAVLYDYVEVPLELELTAPLWFAPRLELGLSGGPLVSLLVRCSYREKSSTSGSYQEPTAGAPCESRSVSPGPLVLRPFATPARVALGAAISGLARVEAGSRHYVALVVRWQTSFTGVDRYEPSDLTHRALSVSLGVGRSF